MEKTRKMYVTAEEAAEILGISTGYAYKIIRDLNEELKKRILDKLRQSSNEDFYAGNKRRKDLAQSVLLQRLEGSEPCGLFEL